MTGVLCWFIDRAGLMAMVGTGNGLMAMVGTGNGGTGLCFLNYLV